jgi:hypothetical protein
MLTIVVSIVLLFSLSIQANEFDEKKLQKQIEANEIDTFDLSDVSVLGNLLSLLPSSPFFDQLKRVSIRDLRAMRGLTTNEVTSSYGFAGTVQVDLGAIKPALEVKVIMATTVGGKQAASILVSTPKGWVLKDLLPTYSNDKIGSLPMPGMNVIISDFDYTEPEYLLPIEKGLNIVARADLAAISDKLNKFIDMCTQAGKESKPGWKSGIIFDGYDRLFVHGVIKQDLARTRFSINIPLRLGVDFEELKKAGKIKKIPVGLRAIMTDDFVAQLKTDLSFELGSGLRFRLAKQEDEIALRADVSLGVNDAAFKGKMKGILDPAFVDWLALQDVGFEVNIDYKILPPLLALGIPITGFGIRGTMGIGKQENRSTISVGTAIALSATKIPDLIFDGRADVISLENFVQLINDIADQNISIKSLPQVMLTNAIFKVVPQDTYIADKKYEQGVEIGSNIRLGKFEGGLRVLIDAEDDRVSGQGFLKELNLKYLKITGPGVDGIIGTADDGAHIKIDIPPRKGENGLIEVVGSIEIPPLKIKEEVDIALGQYGGHAKFNTVIFKIFHFVCDLNFDLKQAENFTIIVVGKTHFEDIQEKIKAKLLRVYMKMQQKLKSLKRTMDKAVNSFDAKIKKEYERIETKLKEYYAEYDRLDNRCYVDKVPTLCVKRQYIKAKIKVYEVLYKNFLLKHSSSFVKFFPESIGKIADDIAHSENLSRYYKRAINLVVGDSSIKEISGVISGADFKSGKLPYIKVSFYDGDSITVPLDPIRAIEIISEKYVKKAKNEKSKIGGQ